MVPGKRTHVAFVFDYADDRNQATSFIPGSAARWEYITGEPATIRTAQRSPIITTTEQESTLAGIGYGTRWIEHGATE